jgi:hypothetical protein
MPEFLKMTHLSDDDGASYVKIWSGGIETRLYLQRLACLLGPAEFPQKFFFRNYFRGTPSDYLELLFRAQLALLVNTIRQKSTLYAIISPHCESFKAVPAFPDGRFVKLSSTIL